MRRAASLVAALAIGFATLLEGQSASLSGRVIAVDAVVVDRDGAPVLDVRREEFTVRENGRHVVLDSFDPAEPAAAGRSIVLVLDDVRLPASYASRVRTIARAFLARARLADAVRVVRVSRNDELAGTREVMAARIDDYAGGIVPDDRGIETSERALRLVARLSRDLSSADAEPRRHTVVWIGAVSAINVREPVLGPRDLLWEDWIEAVSGAARTNLSVYAIEPTSGDAFLPTDIFGLIFKTGGAAFQSAYVAPLIDQVWRETGPFYMLGYTAQVNGRPLHTVDVRVSRPGVEVRARRVRD